jgi:cytochrome c oxidase assembly protein subunit 15
VFHLIVAGALVLQAAWTVIEAWRAASQARGLRRSSLLVLSLVALQIVLGIGTYVAKYSWPAWLGNYQFAAAHVVVEKSLEQSLLTTAHVANGSLILFVATWLAMRSSRCFFSGAGFPPAGMASWQPAPQQVIPA